MYQISEDVPSGPSMSLPHFPGPAKRCKNSDHALAPPGKSKANPTDQLCPNTCRLVQIIGGAVEPGLLARNSQKRFTFGLVWQSFSSHCSKWNIVWTFNCSLSSLTAIMQNAAPSVVIWNYTIQKWRSWQAAPLSIPAKHFDFCESSSYTISIYLNCWHLHHLSACPCLKTWCQLIAGSPSNNSSIYTTNLISKSKSGTGNSKNKYEFLHLNNQPFSAQKLKTQDLPQESGTIKLYSGLSDLSIKI